VSGWAVESRQERFGTSLEEEEDLKGRGEMQR